MKLRQAKDSELGLIANINRNCGYRWSRQLDASYYQNRIESGDVFIILEDERKAIGFGSLTEMITRTPKKLVLFDDAERERFSRATKIHLLSVLEKYHGKGYGRVIVNGLLEEAELRGQSYVYLFTDVANTNAVAFYSHLGFHIKGFYANKYGEGKHALFLGKEI